MTPKDATGYNKYASMMVTDVSLFPERKSSWQTVSDFLYGANSSAKASSPHKKLG